MKLITRAKMRPHIYLHKISKNWTLSSVYSKYSEAKEKALDDCYYLMWKYCGQDGKIITANTFTFTFGFYGKFEGKEAFFYITAWHNYVCIL